MLSMYSNTWSPAWPFVAVHKALNQVLWLKACKHNRSGNALRTAVARAHRAGLHRRRMVPASLQAALCMPGTPQIHVSAMLCSLMLPAKLQ